MFDLQRSISTTVVEQRSVIFPRVPDVQRVSDNSELKAKGDRRTEGVLRSKSDFQIPKMSPPPSRSDNNNFFYNIAQKSDSLLSFLTPLAKRRAANLSEKQSTPKPFAPENSFKVPSSPNHKYVPQRSMLQARTSSLTSLKSASAKDGHVFNAACQCVLQR